MWCCVLSDLLFYCFEIMAELDDFFAKKDRKKTKSKKFATPDELAKKLEDTTKKNESKVRKEPQSIGTTQSDGVEIESAEQLPPVEVCFPKILIIQISFSEIISQYNFFYFFFENELATCAYVY